MPCRHLRPSSGREHTIVQLIQSSDDDYLMNETRRKPTTGRQSPSLFDKWHGIFYMTSRHQHVNTDCCKCCYKKYKYKVGFWLLGVLMACVAVAVFPHIESVSIMKDLLCLHQHHCSHCFIG